MIKNTNIYLERPNDSPWQNNQLIDWRPLFEQSPRKIVSKDSIIYRQGEYQDLIFYIVKGRVKASILGEDGNEKTIMIFIEGAIFGEDAIIERAPSLMTTTANTTCHFFYMYRNQFLDKVIHNPHLSLQLTYHFANITRVLTHHINEVTFMSANERVANYLLKLSEIFREKTEQGLKITLPFTQQQMADLAGISRVTVSKIMSELDRIGIVQKINGFHYIKNMDLLHEWGKASFL